MEQRIGWKAAGITEKSSGDDSLDVFGMQVGRYMKLDGDWTFCNVKIFVYELGAVLQIHTGTRGTEKS